MTSKIHSAIGLDTVLTVSSRPYLRDVTDYVFIRFENAPLDVDTVRHGLDLLFLPHEVFKNVTTVYREG